MPEMPSATLLAALEGYNLLPAIVFLPTRRRCDQAASEAALTRRTRLGDHFPDFDARRIRCRRRARGPESVAVGSDLKGVAVMAVKRRFAAAPHDLAVGALLINDAGRVDGVVVAQRPGDEHIAHQSHQHQH